MRSFIALVIGLVLFCGAAVNPADLVMTIDAHFAAVNALGVSDDGYTLFSGGKDGKLKLWDTETFELLMEVPACQSAINDVAVSDQDYIVTAGDDGYIKVWDSETAAIMTAIRAHEGAASCVAISPDGLTIFSGGDDGFIRSWNVEEDYAMVHEIHAHYYGVNDIIFFNDGDFIATGGVDGYITSYDAVTGALQSRIKAFENAEVLCLAFNSLDNYETCLLTGGTNGEIRCWDSYTGSMTKKIRAHAGNVNFIQYIDDDSLVVSAGEDGKIKLWNTEAEKAGEMQAHVLAVRDLLIAGDAMYTCGADFKVRIWDTNF